MRRTRPPLRPTWPAPRASRRTRALRRAEDSSATGAGGARPAPRAPARGAGAARRPPQTRRRSSAAARGQHELERRALPHLALDLDVTAERLRELTSNREPEARAAAIERPERAEDTFAFLRDDARAGVLDRH